ncbi:MAG: hypothetical protein ACRDJN_11535 [Chloroflexota bacterium]
MDTGDGRSDRLHDDEQSAVTRRRMIGAASMTLAAPGLLGLAACAVPGAQPGAHEQQPVTLQAYMNLSGDRLNGFSAFVAPYIEANPHVTVEAVPYPGSGTAEAVAKLQVLVSGGEPPHIWDGPSSAE